MEKENLEAGKVSQVTTCLPCNILVTQHGVDEDNPIPGDHCQSSHGN